MYNNRQLITQANVRIAEIRKRIALDDRSQYLSNNALTAR
jgi:hypothetical protein